MCGEKAENEASCPFRIINATLTIRGDHFLCAYYVPHTTYVITNGCENPAGRKVFVSPFPC